MTRTFLASLLLLLPLAAQTTGSSTILGTACHPSIVLVPFPGSLPPKIGVSTTHVVTCDQGGSWVQWYWDVILAPPIDLTSLGMTGCTAYVGTGNASNIININGGNISIYAIAIPNDPGLVGQSFGLQAIHVGNIAGSLPNAAGVVTTNARTILIGNV